MDEERISRPRAWVAVIVGWLVVLASMWVAQQRGVRGGNAETFAGPVYVLATAGPWVALFWLAAIGWGWLVRRLLAPAIGGGAGLVVQAGAGAGVLLVLSWLTAWLVGLYAALSWVLLGLGAAWLVPVWIQHNKQNKIARPASLQLPLTAIALAPALGLLLIAVACPPGVLWSVEAHGYDVTSYHLQLPHEWLQAGRMIELRHNVFGYLPSLMEAGYTMLGTLTGGMNATAIYASQLLHVSFALLAAAAVGVMVARAVGSAAGGWSAALLLALPWTVITGSMAYNDAATLGLGATALLVALSPNDKPNRVAALAGFLAGAATLCKLTSGVMFAVPVGLIMVWGTGAAHNTQNAPRAIRVRRALRAAGVAALAGLLTLSPYLVRNTARTGNPVFPFAAETLGRAHWNEGQVTRWRRAVTAEGGVGHRLYELARRGVCNPGFGAIGGTPRDASTPTHDITLFDREWGFPLPAVLAGIGLVVGLWRRTTRFLAAAMAVTLVIQVVFWMTATHLQSRFLLPAAIPVVTLTGLALGAGMASAKPLIHLLGRYTAVLTAAIVTASSFSIFYSQTIAALPPWQVTDSLPSPEQLDQMTLGTALVGDHPINRLPTGTRTLLVADVSPLLYLRRPVDYATAFDTNPLTAIIQRVGDDPAAVTLALKDAGFTHVWVHWGEVARLQATIGLDDALAPERLRRLTEHWTAEPGLPDAVGLYALP